MIYFFLTIAIIVVVYYIVLAIYYNSESFFRIKNSIEEYTANSNELNQHIEELKSLELDIRQVNYGLGEFNDNSIYNFKRTERDNERNNKYTINCSSTVCRNAKNQPFKYLCKYFNIKPNEETLRKTEELFNIFSSVEEGKELLKAEHERIIKSIRSSFMIDILASIDRKRLEKNLGFDTIDYSDLYVPVYSFQYISAGGNSSYSCDIILNKENLEIFINYLSDLIKFKNSVEGQRALMTAKLREEIKKRDDYTCQKCGLSIYDEKNLLLEIDHIIPLSKGGITSHDNLQTLCWKCNRKKGNKIL